MGKFFDTWNKIYGSKVAKTTRDFLLGKDMDLSDEEYRDKHGYNKPDTSVGIAGMLVAPEWSGVEHLTKGLVGFGGKTPNLGLEALETERAARRSLKAYDAMAKRDSFLKERFGKVWNEFTPSEQYGLKVKFGDKWLKDGGILKAQGGTIAPYSNPNPINEWIRKTVDNNPTLYRMKQGFQHYKDSPMHDIASFAIPDDISSAMTPIAGPKNFIKNAESFHGLGKEASELLTLASKSPLHGLFKARVVNMIERLNTNGEKISKFELNRQIGRLKKYLIEIEREAAEDARIMGKYKPYKEPSVKSLDTKRIQKIVDSDLTPFDEMRTLQQTGSKAKTTMNFRMSDMMWKEGGVLKGQNGILIGPIPNKENWNKWWLSARQDKLNLTDFSNWQKKNMYPEVERKLSTLKYKNIPWEELQTQFIGTQHYGHVNGSYNNQEHTVYLPNVVKETFPGGIIREVDLSKRPSKYIHETAHGAFLLPQALQIDGILDSKYNDSYWDDPSEINSRLMEVRFMNKLDPSHVFTEDEVNNFKENPNFIDYNILNRYDTETVVRLLNEVAINNQNNLNLPNKQYV